MIYLAITVFALWAGWFIGEVIRDFQRKRYVWFGLDTALAIMNLTFMIRYILKL